MDERVSSVGGGGEASRGVPDVTAHDGEDGGDLRVEDIG